MKTKVLIFIKYRAVSHIVLFKTPIFQNSKFRGANSRPPVMQLTASTSNWANGRSCSQVVLFVSAWDGRQGRTLVLSGLELTMQTAFSPKSQKSASLFLRVPSCLALKWVIKLAWLAAWKITFSSVPSVCLTVSHCRGVCLILQKRSWWKNQSYSVEILSVRTIMCLRNDLTRDCWQRKPQSKKATLGLCSLEQFSYLLTFLISRVDLTISYPSKGYCQE